MKLTFVALSSVVAVAGMMDGCEETENVIAAVVNYLHQSAQREAVDRVQNLIELSARGEFTVFVSTRSDLDPTNSDTNGVADVYRRNNQTGAVLLISRSGRSGPAGNGASYAPSLSADGRYIVFVSEATDLDDQFTDGNNASDVFLADAATVDNAGVFVELVSRGNQLVTANGRSGNPRISLDGKTIVFETDATDLDGDSTNDNNGATDVFVKSPSGRQSGYASTLKRQSQTSGRFDTGNGASFDPSVSADGSVITFTSLATDLLTRGAFEVPDANAASDVFAQSFVRRSDDGFFLLAGPKLISVNASGTATGNGASFLPTVSSRGGVVVFESLASDLAPNDTNGERDVFLADMRGQGVTRPRVDLVSVNAAGSASGNGDSGGGSSRDDRTTFSPSGGAIIFQSAASDLVANDSNGHRDLFRRVDGVTEIIQESARAATRRRARGRRQVSSQTATPFAPAVDDDRFGSVSVNFDASLVLFSSSLPDVLPGLSGAHPQMFLWHASNGAIDLISHTPEGTAGNGDSFTGALSTDGSAIVFGSGAPDLVSGSTRGGDELFVASLVPFVNRERFGAKLVSTKAGAGASANDDSLLSALSASGEVVAFASAATDLVRPLSDTNATLDLFLKRLRTGQVELVSATPSGAAGDRGAEGFAALDADGRFVAFTSSSDDLGPGPSHGFPQIFFRDMQTRTTTLLSAGGAGGGNGRSRNLQMSLDGRVVVFESAATDLLGVQTSPGNIYLSDTSGSRPILVSANRDGNGGNRPSLNPQVNASGQVVVFQSAATDLLPTDTASTSRENIFLRDLAAGATQLVSVDRFGKEASGGAGPPSIDATGRLVAFFSFSSDLVAGDTNNSPDVFLRDTLNGTTIPISVDQNGALVGGLGPLISANGRFVTFFSQGSNIVPSQPPGFQVFVREVQAGVTVLASIDELGQPLPPADAFPTSISAEGRFVAFLHREVNRRGDESYQVYVRDIVAGTSVLASANARGQHGNGTPAFNKVYQGALNYNGEIVAFSSNADNFTAQDRNKGADVFIARARISGGLSAFKPDASIRKLVPRTATRFAGDEVFSGDGRGQTAGEPRTGRGSAKNFEIRIQNDAPDADVISLQGNGGLTAGFTVSYTSDEGDISAAIQAGTYQTSLSPGGFTTIKLRIATTRATLPGSKQTCLITARSNSDATKLDAVKAEVTVR